MADDSDRVIPATPRRREAARRQGAMPTAALPAWVATAGTATLLLPVWAAATMPAAAGLVRTAMLAAADPRPFDPWPGLVAVALPTAAVVVAAAAAGMTVRLLLDGFSWQPARLTPSLHRIDPFAGLARIFSWRTVTATLGGGVGLAVMVVAAWLAMRPLVAPAGLPGIGDESRVAAAAWRAAAWLFAAGASVAIVRWLAARRRFEQRIRMTPEEFAEEAKTAQADPKVRLLQQQRQRQPTAGAA
jgi:flagellar biosynthesis protein FlhB